MNRLLPCCEATFIFGKLLLNNVIGLVSRSQALDCLLCQHKGHRPSRKLKDNMPFIQIPRLAAVFEKEEVVGKNNVQFLCEGCSDIKGNAPFDLVNVMQLVGLFKRIIVPI